MVRILRKDLAKIASLQKPLVRASDREGPHVSLVPKQKQFNDVNKNEPQKLPQQQHQPEVPKRS